MHVRLLVHDVDRYIEIGTFIHIAVQFAYHKCPPSPQNVDRKSFRNCPEFPEILIDTKA